MITTARQRSRRTASQLNAGGVAGSTEPVFSDWYQAKTTIQSLPYATAIICLISFLSPWLSME
jgi:hypothetical protein